MPHMANQANLRRGGRVKRVRRNGGDDEKANPGRARGGDPGHVEDGEEKVRVARAGSLVLVHVEKPGGREAVRVEVPVDVVDALLSGDTGTLDIRAAFAKLQNRRGDIVSVHDEDATVRIWIDEG